MKIGIDIMGGDHAPGPVIAGAVAARSQLGSDVELVLIGDHGQIEPGIEAEGGSIGDYTIVHATEVVEMGEHPTKAIQNKRDSSIVKGFGLLQAGAIDGFASAGNTGAMMVGAMHVIKAIPGIIRPTIPATLPNTKNKTTVLLDVGLNPDCKADVLYQYGILGSAYAKYVFGYEKPRVALLNIGEEPDKGNLLAKAAYALMQEAKDFDFTGNIEGNELFSGDKAEVIVCEGFTGNVVLKQAEAFYTLLKDRGLNDDFFDRFNYESYGGTPVLGVGANVFITHGKSNAYSIQNMIRNAKDVIEAKLSDKIKSIFS